MSRFKTKKVFKAYIQWQKENYPKCLWCEGEGKVTNGPFAIEHKGKKYHYCRMHNDIILGILKSIEVETLN